jgi:hypothetical protein
MYLKSKQRMNMTAFAKVLQCGLMAPEHPASARR